MQDIIIIIVVIMGNIDDIKLNASYNPAKITIMGAKITVTIKVVLIGYII